MSKNAIPKKKQITKSQFNGNTYYSDISKEDMLYAAIVRSPFANGIIQSIKIPPLDEGYFSFTGHDLQGTNSLKILDTDLHIFCEEKISYKGEPIALIAGPSEATVNELAAKTEIEISKIESQEVKKNANKIVAEKTIKTGHFLKGQKPSEKERKKTVSDIWNYEPYENSCFEPNGAFCYIEEKILYICTPTIQGGVLKKLVSTALKINESSIIIQKTNTHSHEANGLWQNSLLAIKAALVTQATGKPCKLILSRSEHQKFMQKGARAEFECKSHVSEEGKLISLQMNITLDIGSANPYAKNIIDRLVIASLGTYTIPNVFIEAKAVSSNRIPTSINPEMIDSQVFFALENHITHIAEEIKLLPTEFRQKNILPLPKNFVSKNALSKNSIMPFLFKSEYILETIFNTISVSDFNRKHASFMLNAKDHLSRENTFFALPIRGIGFACAFDGSGFLDDESFLKQNKISLTLESEESATINAAPPSPTVLNVWKKIINSTLGITDSNIHLKPFENESEYETSFYSNIGITTQLLSKICLDITKKRPIKKFPLTVKKSIASSAKKTWDKTNFRGGPFYSTSFASAALEVELAPHTYEVNIKSVWITIECGKILVPKAAENAIRTALQQEFQNLIVGEILDCDDVHISFIKSEREPVQIGSLIHSIIPTAFSSALSQALGIRVHSLPCDTEILYTLGEKHENSTTSK